VSARDDRLGIVRLLTAVLRQALSDMDSEDAGVQADAQAWFEDALGASSQTFSFSDVCEVLEVSEVEVGTVAFTPEARRRVVAELTSVLDSHHKRETRLGRTG
jgi:hypothetical protein